MPSETSSKSFRVLIADDVLQTRRSTRLMLAEIPAIDIVAIAHNGKEAVELAKKYNPDIALLDINMPEMSGFSAFKAIRKTDSNVECIIISAERDTQAFRAAMSLGVSEYLVKPFTVDQLSNAIDKVGRIITKKRAEHAKMAQLRAQRETYLEQLAHEYAKTRQTDDQAVKVFEALAKNPNCKLRWLRILAMIYIVRSDWKKLLALAKRLEQRSD